MAISFISKQVSKAKEPHPDASLIRLLVKDMAGYEPARSVKTTHASDVTKDDFCPRKVCLLLAHETKPKDQYINAALRATFDVGNATASLVTDKWLRNRAIGNWECQSCLSMMTLQKLPGPCSQCGKNNWAYREMRFEHQDAEISGSLDVVLPVFTDKWNVVELKIIRPEDFEKLAAPLAEHRIRTNLYMNIIANSGCSFAPMFDVDRAIVLYVSRGFGKKHVEHNQILPFKEFPVLRNDEALKPYLAKGKAIKIFKETGAYPAGICSTSADKCAKSCNMVHECFSGKYPVGQS